MSEAQAGGRLTARDRLTARLLRRAPWLAFLIVVPPAPLYFLWRYLTATEDYAVWVLAALTSLGVSTLLALTLVVLLLLYRRLWERRLRDRLASDGVTAGEVEWFTPELTRGERRALKEMQRQNALLADAYRETLAARLTATRVAEHTRRERASVERRLTEAASLRGENRARLEAELRADVERLERVGREAEEHRAEAETRLHMIEAAASRGLSESETEIALLRLDTQRGQLPYALEATRTEQQARAQVERLLREGEGRGGARGAD